MVNDNTIFKKWNFFQLKNLHLKMNNVSWSLKVWEKYIKESNKKFERTDYLPSILIYWSLIFVYLSRRPLIFLTNNARSNSQSLKYKNFTWSGWADI